MQRIVLCVLMLGCLLANARERTFASHFTINSAESVFTMTATVNGVPMLAQAPGSLTEEVQGTLEVNVLANSIEFPGGSSIAFLSQPGPFQPFDLPGNFASILDGVGSGAIRNGSFDLKATSQPIIAGSFATPATFDILTGSIDFIDYNLISQSDNGAGIVVTNVATDSGSVANFGLGLRLVVPVDATIGFYGNPVRLVGQVVAYSNVPEPGSLLLALAGLATLVFAHVRRTRRG